MDQTSLPPSQNPHGHSFRSHKDSHDQKEDQHGPLECFRSFPRQDLHRSIPDRFEDQVQLFPHSIAVKTEFQTWTYEELNHQANRIARMVLAEKGSESQPIALIMETGCPMMAAIMGILKARRFFILLDPLQPPSRGKHILTQAQTSLILTNNSTLPIARELSEDAAHLINIDEIDNTLSLKNLELTISPDNLAYIVYTSGSTGQPKGVMQNHRNVLHKAMEHTNSFYICHEDRLGLLYSPSFSGAMRDIFSSLLNGAGLFPFDIKREGIHRLANWLIQEEITVYNSVATVFRHLVGNMNGKRPFPNLRLIQLGSEPIYASDVDLFKNNFSENCRFVARYGTSEIAPIRWLSINHDTQIPSGIVPAGYPVPDIDVVLLDEVGQEVGDGQIGEITVKSRYLTPGYWGMPELNQSKFQPDSTDPDRTVYRTGDLGYVLPDGCLVPIGRTDSQIKIRGYRIEIGEIEAALLTLKVVKETAVILQEDDPKGKRLIAYLVTHTDEQPSANTIRRHLTEILPDYMIPEKFAFLHTLPLTGAGKIDRRAIAQLDPEVASLEIGYVAPRTPDEEMLLKLWREVLNVEALGIHDNFFDLGGHSLLATQILSRVHEAFGVTLPLRTLFETPTVAGLASALKQNKKLYHGKESPPPIEPLPPGNPFPLSFSQERMWFLYHLAPTSAAYNIPWIFHFSGPILLDVLEQAVNEIRRRHAVLRTIFPAEDGYPIPRILPFSPLSIPVKDFQDCQEDIVDTKVQSLARAEAKRPFNIAQGPLIRITFVRIPAEQVLVLLTQHHIITDGWSAEVFRHELETLYEAFAAGQPSPFDELPIQYQDFAAWQRGWLQGKTLDTQLTYWTKHLAGAPMVLDLPHDRPRGTMQTFAGRRHVVEFSRTLTVDLTHLTQREEVTLFMTLLASLSIQLGRYTGSNDLLVGAPIANRHFLAIEGLLGTFVNTLVLRTKLEGNPTFLELLHQVRHTTLEAYAHQDLPFEVLVDALQPPRDLSRSPVFQLMLTVQNFHQVPLAKKNKLTWKSSADRQAAQFDLTINVEERPDQRHFMKWSYNSDLFDQASIERMSAQFVHLLEEVATYPHRRIDDFTLLPNHERQLLLVDWNQTDRSFPSIQCIHTYFEAQVARTPKATAVVAEEQLTYAQLNVRANQLAAILQQEAVGPGTLVGLCVERSVEMMVGLLGILKAGAAYVPLDPTYPPDRIHFMINDAQLPVIVTHRRLHEQLHLDQGHDPISSPSRPTFVELDTFVWKEEGFSTGNPISTVTPQDLMYVIYTSGSTGKPKGVMIVHQTVGNFLHAMHKELSLTHQDIFLALTSISFDIAVLELFGPLLVGGCVYLVSRDTAMDGKALIQALQKSKASFMQATPVTWQLLLESDWPGSPDLHAVCGGEALSSSLAHSLLEKGVILWNMYGPTETTVWSTMHRVSPGDQKIPIGRPIANTHLYVLDDKQHLMPVGVPGELYIGGKGLSPGYWRRDELTREKFLPNPFSSVPGNRLYRTGDRARYRVDGTLEFLGRIDQQIKLRGFRIELGEIETVLGQHPDVHEGVVLVRDDGHRGPYLVGYWISAHESGVSVDSMRRFLNERLPEYMVPSAWMELEAFPLTPNGKLDRRALPAPTRVVGTTAAAPRGPLEEAVVEIWQEVLGVDHPGIHDNFFELGGHSLLATQIISRIQRTFHVDLPLRHLFETPTVAGLAETVEVFLRDGQPVETLQIRPVPRDADLPLSLAQQRLWFLDQLEPDKPVYYISNVSRLKGPLELQALEQSFNGLIQRHESLRTTFLNVAGQLVQHITSTFHWSLPVIDLREIPEDEREAEAHRQVKEEVQCPFNLAKGPLFRSTLYRLGPEDHILALSLHHIITDGWSMGVLYRELTLLYASFVQRKPSPLLTTSPVQYADFAFWQRQWLQGERLEKELSYWKSQLAGVSILELPTDRVRPPIQTHNGASHSFTLSEHLTQKLKTLCTQEGSTLFMTLLAAFQTLLHRYADQNDIVVGAPIAGRTQKELEGSIGLFINTLVLRTNFFGKPTFREVMQQVRDMTLGAYAHQVIPFEELLETLKPERNPSYPPLFQVLFVFQNAPNSGLELTGITTSPFKTNRGGAMFDVTLSMSEKAGKLKGVVGYNKDLFEHTTISKMFRHFAMLLEGIVANPDQQIYELPLLTEPEQHQWLKEGMGPSTLPHPGSSIQCLFERQVEQTPASIALSFGEQQLSYEVLNAKANQLARFLQKHGVGPEESVGLCLERTPELIIGMLGILKAGGAYVPLDADYPEERLAFILRDAQITVLVTQSHLQDRLPSHEELIRVNLDTHGGEINKEKQINLPPNVRPENLAYIMYTSGSTGIPKGVMISHESLVNYVDVVKKDFTLEPYDRILQFSSICFDTSAEEIYPCLTSGGALVLRTESLLDSWKTFLAKCRKWQLTVLDLPTAFWHELVAGMDAQGLTLPLSVRLVIIGGERAQPSSLTRWNDVVSESVRLVNTYGPTEGTIVITKGELTRTSSSFLDHLEIPLGKVIPNACGYLLDRIGNPVPFGMPGEFFLGGVGVARGYWRRADITAEKFLPNPFSQNPGGRVFRTGDRMRHLPDRTLKFLGRIDDQIKLRGFRIELGEIQAILSQYPGIKQVVVALKEDERGQATLVSYIIAAEGFSLTDADLQRFMKAKLPPYMIPSATVALQVLPYTPNGKINYHALPRPVFSRREDISQEDFSPTEWQIAEIWKQSLAIDSISVHDNFFDLGGHSLLSIQVISQLESKLGFQLRSGDLMFQTLGQLAADCDEQRSSLRPTSDGGSSPLKQLPFHQKLLQALKNRFFRTK